MQCEAGLGKMKLPIAIAELQRLIKSVQLELIGVLDRQQALEALATAAPFFRTWQEEGYHGAMQYLARPSELFTNLDQLLSDARSVVLCALPYAADAHFPPRHGSGRVARYAWGSDYHNVFRERLTQLATLLTERCATGGVQMRCCSDAVPLLERVLVARCAGWGIGRNSLALGHSYGSYVVVGELLTSLEIEPTVDAIVTEQAPGAVCGRCVRCRTHCPTGAIVSDGVLDARRCISYLTIEKKGALTVEEGRSLGDWIFGCDLCQECCPFNRTVTSDVDPAFLDQEMHGRYLRIEEVLAVGSAEEFRAKFNGRPLLRSKREGLIRNGLWVALNTHFLPAETTLRRLLSQDGSSMLREQTQSVLELFREEAEGRERRIIDALLDRC